MGRPRKVKPVPLSVDWLAEKTAAAASPLTRVQVDRLRLLFAPYLDDLNGAPNLVELPPRRSGDRSGRRAA